MNKVHRVMVIVLGVALVCSPVLAAGPLDGKTFSGSYGNVGSAAEQADNFVFKDGTFASTLCNQFGYKEGIYQIAPGGTATDFTAETVSRAGGKKSWKGAVKGDSLEGTVTTVENGKTEEGWFKGKLKTS